MMTALALAMINDLAALAVAAAESESESESESEEAGPMFVYLFAFGC